MSKRSFGEWSRMVEHLAREKGIYQHLPCREELRERFHASQTPSTVVSCLVGMLADDEHSNEDYGDDDDAPGREKLDTRYVSRAGKSRAARIY